MVTKQDIQSYLGLTFRLSGSDQGFVYTLKTARNGKLYAVFTDGVEDFKTEYSTSQVVDFINNGSWIFRDQKDMVIANLKRSLEIIQTACIEKESMEAAQIAEDVSTEALRTL